MGQIAVQGIAQKVRRRALVMVGACLSIACGVVACGGSTKSPKSALDEYAEALRDGDADEAYNLMSMEFRANVTRKQFAQNMKEHIAEAGQTAERIQSSNLRIVEQAEFAFGLNEKLQLIKESGGWRVSSNPLEFYSQATPRDAVRSFIRAHSLQRWDVMLRLIPNAYRERMTEEMVELQFTGPQKEAMDELIDTLRQNLGTATADLRKDNLARVRYGAAHDVELIREEGLWKINSI